MLLNISRASVVLDSEGIDGVISSTLENNFYMSGMWNLHQDLLPRDAESYVVATANAPERGIVVSSIGGADLVLEAYETISDVITFGTFFRHVVDGIDLSAEEKRVRDITVAHVEGRSPIDGLVQALQQSGLAAGTVAVDERGPNLHLVSQLAEQLPQARFVAGSDLFRRIRAVKTPAELERLDHALRINEAAFRETVASFRTGVTERQLKTVFERTIVNEGARPGFLHLKFGRGMALGQLPPDDTPLEVGDFVFFDMGCNADGYKSDIGRLVSFGEPSQTLTDLYHATRIGQQRVIDAMTPGAIASDVFSLGVDAVRAAGIPDYERQHVGHAIGIEYYDRPILAPGDDTPLEAGMTFEVEMPYYRLGYGGSFIEDTVLVTERGAEIMTTLDRDLLVVDPG